MGEPKKLPLEKIINIAEACTLIGENEALDSTTAYRIGRLATATEAPSKIFNKERTKLLTELREKLEGKTPEEKNKLTGEVNDKLNALLEEEEEIKIPELKLKSFTASKKIKVKDREYEEGQMLVPQRFFNLMGDLVLEN